MRGSMILFRKEFFWMLFALISNFIPDRLGINVDMMNYFKSLTAIGDKTCGNEHSFIIVGTRQG